MNVYHKIVQAITLLLACNLVAEVSCVESNTIIQLEKSLKENLKNFQCDYSYTSKILPGWEKTRPRKEFKPIIDKNGFNENMKVSLKFNNEKCLILDKHINKSNKDLIHEYHYDGQMQWSKRSNIEYVEISGDHPILPPLYNKIIYNFNTSIGFYCNLNTTSSLTDLINDKDNQIKMILEKNLLKLEISRPLINTNKNIYSLYKFEFQLSPDIHLNWYEFSHEYRKDNYQYQFHPSLRIDYSNYISIQPDMAQMPTNIKLTEYKEDYNKLSSIKNMEDYISSDKNDLMIAVRKVEIIVDNIKINPPFSPGEIEFSYPPGTKVFDHFAHRSYIVGDTLEELRKKVEPSSTP